MIPVYLLSITLLSHFRHRLPVCRRPRDYKAPPLLITPVSHSPVYLALADTWLCASLSLVSHELTSDILQCAFPCFEPFLSTRNPLPADLDLSASSA